MPFIEVLTGFPPPIMLAATEQVKYSWVWHAAIKKINHFQKKKKTSWLLFCCSSTELDLIFYNFLSLKIKHTYGKGTRE